MGKKRYRKNRFENTMVLPRSVVYCKSCIPFYWNILFQQALFTEKRPVKRRLALEKKSMIF